MCCNRCLVGACERNVGGAPALRRLQRGLALSAQRQHRTLAGRGRCGWRAAAPRSTAAARRAAPTARTLTSQEACCSPRRSSRPRTSRRASRQMAPAPGSLQQPRALAWARERVKGQGGGEGRRCDTWGRRGVDRHHDQSASGCWRQTGPPRTHRSAGRLRRRGPSPQQQLGVASGAEGAEKGWGRGAWEEGERWKCAHSPSPVIHHSRTDASGARWVAASRGCACGARTGRWRRPNTQQQRQRNTCNICNIHCC